LTHPLQVQVFRFPDPEGVLFKYALNNEEFMAEDVRAASRGFIPDPPSNRAWGGVFVSAKNDNIITPIGYKMVSNPKAHRTPATLWKSLIKK